MRFGNRSGRMVLLEGGNAIDVEASSGGRFDADPMANFARWDELADWARSVSSPETPAGFAPKELLAPSPRPRQVFGLGTNYRKHALELGWPIPEVPMVFTKFSSAVTGPEATVEISGPRVDWEVELVVVVGRGGHRIPAERAWDRIAGFTAGQDLSDRDTQNSPAHNPQFNLGKSYPGFAPIGPAIVTVDEFDDPENLELSCSLNGVEMQSGRTDDFVFSVPEVVEYLSNIVTLLPGDLIFTGTPSGIGSRREPPLFLKPGDELSTWVEGIGELATRFVGELPR